MKRKIRFFCPYVTGLLISGLLVLSGCSQDESQDSPRGAGHAISFRAQGGTGGLKATTTGGDYIHSFVVSAIRDDGSYGAGKHLMRGTTVYRGESGAGWTYAPEVYYPTDGTNNDVEFFAYSPSGSSRVTQGLGATANDSQIPVIGYEVPVPATTGATAQEDLLVAYAKVEKADYANPVKLQFRHALSRILVSAKSDLSVPVVITGLELKNVYSKGDLNLEGNSTGNTGASDGIPVSESSSDLTVWEYNAPASITTTDDYVTLWDNLSALEAYPYVLPASGVSVGATNQPVTSAEQGMFVLPQTTEGDPTDDQDIDDEFSLLVSYTLNGAAKTATIQFADLNGIADAGVTFEIGRQYVLNLDFKTGGNVPIGALITFNAIDIDDYKDPGIDVPKKDYVEIAGIKWAKYNVDAPGTFVKNETDPGMFYQFGRGTVGWSNADPLTQSPAGPNTWDSSYETDADWDLTGVNNPCPPGWTVPTVAQLTALNGKKDQWHTNYQGTNVPGHGFVDGNEYLFLPATGMRDSFGTLHDQNAEGFYMSSTYGSSHQTSVLCFRDFYTTFFDNSVKFGHTVRCVKI